MFMFVLFFLSVFKGVDLHPGNNNLLHHTSEISVDQLIVRRGQPFKLTLNVAQPFDPKLHQLHITAKTGQIPTEKQGTLSLFGVPDVVTRSRSAIAVWKADLHKDSSLQTLVLNLTPPAVTPVGEWILSVKLGGEEMLLGKLVVLYNPWCTGRCFICLDENEIKEYVMNEQGVIYKGNERRITCGAWDFGQFEDNMVEISLMILDLNLKHEKDPADDVSARCNPIYVSRVVCAMINSQDDRGVLQGNWGNSYIGGHPPTHWSGSYPILRRWYNIGAHPVKYGQCWVFAGVMCSVMRLLGIPCRVVTNFSSAHDNNANLIIDEYHADYGVAPKASHDSIWNYHVWVEAWMRRPDLSEDGAFDGWQVVDPTPQEKSDGIFCCGPAPVKAILKGETNLKYDIPFVFSEVNADCIDWLVKADGSKLNIFSDTVRVGHNISTKSVGSIKRLDITDSYKYREGTEKEREVSPPRNGKDVRLKLLLRSESSSVRSLSVNISVQAMTYNGLPAASIQTEVKDKILLPGTDLCIRIRVPFSAYHKPMLDCDSLKVSALVTDKERPDNMYLAVDDVVLIDPPISLKMTSSAKVNHATRGEVIFMNPVVTETLTNCTLTLSGSGLMKEDVEPNNRLRVNFSFVPYKCGKRTLVADFDCSTFRDIKASCAVYVQLSRF
ncbi:Protein-glutamine gamma-glutamyltransferase 5 [Dissostichus eleginoides]|uniref:Protein-glutamine gamma-glutamyltransferase 2 n=1 Tax=Dissostichus eleginoides TaxID=100907 RepID=A0AAD9FG84_DISEL|nr:Protein-glutamine gamma-glutamyltransferase 5 [Dissostichus eleginoides]